MEPSIGEYVALYDFDAVEDAEMSLKKGEKVGLIEDVGEGWSYVSSENRRNTDGTFGTNVGYVPSSYIREIQNPPRFVTEDKKSVDLIRHGSISFRKHFTFSLSRRLEVLNISKRYVIMCYGSSFFVFDMERRVSTFETNVGIYKKLMFFRRIGASIGEIDEFIGVVGKKRGLGMKYIIFKLAVFTDKDDEIVLSFKEVEECDSTGIFSFVRILEGGRIIFLKKFEWKRAVVVSGRDYTKQVFNRFSKSAKDFRFLLPKVPTMRGDYQCDYSRRTSKIVLGCIVHGGIEVVTIQTKNGFPILSKKGVENWTNLGKRGSHQIRLFEDLDSVRVTIPNVGDPILSKIIGPKTFSIRIVQNKDLCIISSNLKNENFSFLLVDLSEDVPTFVKKIEMDSTKQNSYHYLDTFEPIGNHMIWFAFKNQQKISCNAIYDYESEESISNFEMGSSPVSIVSTSINHVEFSEKGVIPTFFLFPEEHDQKKYARKLGISIWKDERLMDEFVHERLMFLCEFDESSDFFTVKLPGEVKIMILKLILL